MRLLDTRTDDIGVARQDAEQGGGRTFLRADYDKIHLHDASVDLHLLTFLILRRLFSVDTENRLIA